MKSQVFLDFLYIILLSVLDIANFFLSVYIYTACMYSLEQIQTIGQCEKK